MSSPQDSIVRSSGSCYHGVSWTAWAISWNWQWIFTSPYWWPE